MADINNLPDEVLVRIFYLYLQTDTQLNFINCVSNVCKKWKVLAKDSSFFETLDGSLPLHLIVNLAKAGALQRTKSLKFGPLNKDKSDHYKTIFTNTPQLRHLDLTWVSPKFNKLKKHAVFTELEGLCPELCELVLSHPDAHCEAIISVNIFENILTVRGSNFVKLDFSSIMLPQMQKLFVLIANNCPNLEELLAQNLMGGTTLRHKFPVEKMQNGCPKIKTLRLGFPIIITKKSRKDAVGFPNLEIFTHPSRDDYHFTSSDLEVLLFNSPNLKILDFRGCLFVTYEAVNSLPATDLEQIYLSCTRMLQSKLTSKLFQKWSHSLNVIYVSHVKGEHINQMFLPTNLPNGLPNLEVMDVNTTAIIEDTLEIIIQQCPKLRFLNLEACRSLRRGTRSIYRSRSAIEELLIKFDKNKIDCN